MPPKPSRFRLVYRRFDRVSFDPGKSDEVLDHHGIDLAHASRIFPGAVLEREDTRDYGERRYQVIGAVGDDLLFVVYTPRDGVCRLITARYADHEEELLWHDVF